MYWLSTHCDGDASVPLKYLSNIFDDELMDLVSCIKPTRWSVRKLEAINLKEDLLWFDDVLHSSEERGFKAAGKLDSFVLVNLYENEDFWLDWVDL